MFNLDNAKREFKKYIIEYHKSIAKGEDVKFVISKKVIENFENLGLFFKANINSVTNESIIVNENELKHGEYFEILKGTIKEKKLKDKLIIANKELVFQRKEKKRASELNLIEIIRQLSDDNERLKKMSYLDGLTGIANRRNFDQELIQENMRAKRDNTPLSLIMIDVDYFKGFNDTYGHFKGDVCLKTVASTIEKTLKRPGDFSARYGGEEFVVLLPNTNAAGAAIVAENLRTNVEKSAIVYNNSNCADYVTVSLGIVTRLSEQTETPDELIVAADRALYHSKHEGRNRVSVWNKLYCKVK